jgi:LysM repeat protein
VRRLFLIPIILALLMVSIAPAFAQTEAQAAYAGQTWYVVQRGDTLASIARWFGTTVQAIASANGIYNVNFIYPGQQLIIPAGSYPQPQPQPQNYIVQRGDTLARIAARFGTTVWAIAQANNIQNINWIYAGMYLTIPTGGGYPPPQPPPQQPNVIPYTVQRGDTLARIAAQYGSTVQAIASYNNIWNPNRIYWGLVIYIPIY